MLEPKWKKLEMFILPSWEEEGSIWSNAWLQQLNVYLVLSFSTISTSNFFPFPLTLAILYLVLLYYF